MKIIIVGGVAAGPKAAAKIKRENPDAEVFLYTKSSQISYAGCGLPYYIGDVISSESNLIVNTPQKFSALTNAQVYCRMEMLSLLRAEKKILLKNLDTGEDEYVSYDFLVLATGADSVRPEIPGNHLPGVFTLRTPEDAAALRRAADNGMNRAILVGGGMIGLETAENLRRRGIRVSIFEMKNQILPGFDKDFSDYLISRLSDEGIPVLTETRITEIIGTDHVEKVRTDGRTIKADAVIFSAGVCPNTGFLTGSGLELAPNGAVLTDSGMRTNDPFIFAIGDCACVKNSLTAQRTWSPMGSSANLEGRVAANVICGKNDRFAGVLGTAVAKVGSLNAARTGLSHSQALALGYDACSTVVITDDKAHYYPDASNFLIRLTCDRATRKLLGLQVMGSGAVDKIADIAATALTLNATLDQVESMDLAYAPPFSTAIHPFSVAVNVLGNKLRGAFRSAVWDELDRSIPYTMLDVSATAAIPGARHIDLTSINGPLQDLPCDTPLLLICTRGKRAYLAQRRLNQFGYQNTLVLEGGTTFLCEHLQNLSD